ncbi:hypothetical protein [Shewanella sp. SE1]|uniref:hypothetical protein n=1 Tax=Shewanella sp. SE1 TaxID=2705014 RepID=UPI00138F0A9C|nr:hypothetical protein [Shewanella sp. SE1]NDO73073.1 hypothetical protein [Shewanella sp. SE1]
MSTREQLLGLSKRVYSFEFNETTVYFKLPTVKQAMSGFGETDYQTNMILGLVTDSEGNNIFTEADRELVEELPGNFVTALFEHMSRIQNQNQSKKD